MNFSNVVNGGSSVQVDSVPEISSEGLGKPSLQYGDCYGTDFFPVLIDLGLHTKMVMVLIVCVSVQLVSLLSDDSCLRSCRS